MHLIQLNDRYFDDRWGHEQQLAETVIHHLRPQVDVELSLVLNPFEDSQQRHREMRPLRHTIYGVLLSLSLSLIGFEHEVTVNYERTRHRESATNFELPVDRLCSLLCHCDALPRSHIATSHYHCHPSPSPQTTPDGGSFKTIRYRQTGTQTNFGWPLSIASRLFIRARYARPSTQN